MRVYLRPPVERDAAEFTSLNRRSTSLHRGLASPPKTHEQFLAFLTRVRQPASVCFLVCRNEDDAIVGAIMLHQIFQGPFRSAYLGYFIGAPFANRGYMTEALQLMLRYAFKKIKLHRLEANIQPGNTASIALVRRAGFRREGYSPRYLKICGRWRDHERWAITVEDWRSLKTDFMMGDGC
ncbi:MAG TPA: GNAT family protein [Pyrinomonadaceae bacterium]